MALLALNLRLADHIFAGVWLAGNSTNATIVFIVDVSLSMGSRIQSAGLAVADMIERGISGKLKDGDKIELWTYTDKLNTNVMPSLTWFAGDARHISNLVFLKIKNLRATRNYNVPMNLNRAFSVSHLSNVTVYVVTDGNRKIQGIPIEEEVSNVLLFNKDRWKRDRFVCILGLDFKNNVLVNWAIGEADILSSIKTIARMPEPPKLVDQTTEKEVKTQDVTAAPEKREVADSIAKNKEPEPTIKSVSEKTAEITTSKEAVKPVPQTVSVKLESTNKIETLQNQNRENIVQRERASSQKINIVGKADEMLREKQPINQVAKDATLNEKETNKITGIDEKKPPENTTIITNELNGTTSVQQVKVSAPEIIKVDKNQGSQHDEKMILQSSSPEKTSTGQLVSIRQLAEKEKQIAMSSTRVGEVSGAMVDHSKGVTNAIAEKPVINAIDQTNYGNVRPIISEYVSHLTSNTTRMLNNTGLIIQTAGKIENTETIAAAHDKSPDWLLRLAIILAGAAIILWIIAMWNFKSGSVKHSLITKGYSKKNLIKK